MKKIIPAISLLIFLACQLPESRRAYIAGFNGAVTVNGTSVKAKGFQVKYSDVLETGKNSYCDIIIDEKNIIRIKDNTRFVYMISANENTMQLDRGWMAAVIRKRFTNTGEFLIKTPAVTASIRGTSFFVRAGSDRSTYFCVCNGSVTLAGGGQSMAETVTAAAHAGRTYTMDKNTGYITIDRNPGLLYHDSSTLDELASQIDEKIDWTVPDSM